MSQQSEYIVTITLTRKSDFCQELVVVLAPAPIISVSIPKSNCMTRV